MMSTAEAARRLGVSRQRVHQLIASGRLRAARDEYGDWQIDPAAIKARQREVRRGPTVPAGFVSVEDAAAARSVHPDTIRSWCERGVLRSRRVGRRLFVDERSLVKAEPPRRGRPPGV